MPPQKSTRPEGEQLADDERAAQEDEAARLAEDEAQRSAEYAATKEAQPEPGPTVIDGPFGTTVDSTDQRLGTLRVEIKSNVTLGNELFRVGQKVLVVDDAETRGAIGVGHVRLLEDDEQLDSE